MKVRAFYKGDLRYDKFLIFEKHGDRFICITEPDIAYDDTIVLMDDDWIVFTIEDDIVKIRNDELYESEYDVFVLEYKLHHASRLLKEAQDELHTSSKLYVDIEWYFKGQYDY